MKGYNIVSADGTAVDYKMKTNSSYYKNSIVKVTFENGYAKLSRVSEKSDLSGVFDYENKTIRLYRQGSDTPKQVQRLIFTLML